MRHTIEIRNYYKIFDGAFIVSTGKGEAKIKWVAKLQDGSRGPLYCSYDGEIDNWKQNGNGVLAFPDGQKTTAIWKDDHVVGNATIEWPHGESYVGPVNESGQPHGPGTRTFSDGGVYTGEHVNGTPTRGVTEYPDGSQSILGDLVDPAEYDPPPLAHIPLYKLPANSPFATPQAQAALDMEDEGHTVYQVLKDIMNGVSDDAKRRDAKRAEIAKRVAESRAATAAAADAKKAKGANK